MAFRTDLVAKKSTKGEELSMGNIENDLLTRDEWLRLAAEGSQLGLWYWSEIGNSLFCDAKTREIFGVPQDEPVGLQTLYDALHPDDRARTIEIWRYQLENGIPYELEYRTKRRDGSVRWVSARGRGHYENGKPLYMVGVVFDITDEKEAERERAELSGRLIVAQEEERAHIARELHDDFSQRLALLKFQLDMVSENGVDPTHVSDPLSEAKQLVTEIVNDMHELSHRLHSSTVELLGLVTTARSHCKRFASQHGLTVEFADIDVPASIPIETSLALFRIMQEAMANSLKHSKASKLDVRLKGESDMIFLSVSDDGVGIDLGSDYLTNGIGISSMKERMRMLGGTFVLLSGPYMRGTKITVSVPNRQSLTESGEW